GRKAERIALSASAIAGAAATAVAATTTAAASTAASVRAKTWRRAGALLRRAGPFGDERQQRLVVLAAGRAALEVGAHPGDRRLGVGPRDLELDVAVQVLEARLARHLGRGRPEQAAEHLVSPHRRSPS